MITQEQKTTITTLNGQFVALVENGVIYQLQPFTGQKAVVGVVQSEYDELQKITEDYYKKLVEAGIIIEPKTPEQIIAEQQEAMAKMLEAINNLNKKVEDLENGRNANSETV